MTRYPAPMRIALLCLLLGACKGGPPPISPDAEPTIVEAEALLASGDHGAAVALLRNRDKATFPKRLQDRYELTLARGQSASGDHWTAFETIRDFADRHPHSELRRAVVDLEFDIGRTLVRSDRGFLFFWSDRRAGRTVLEHLVTRYPDNAHLADALRLLGDLAFAAGDHPLAQERFRDLVRRQPESEWVPYARYRFAMSIVAALRGPDYDLDQMELATRELRDFLRDPPENPEFVAAANAALAQMREWRAERHLRIAGFYATVGNAPGRRHHLLLASTAEFDATAAAALAKAQLQQLDAAPEGSR